MMQRGHGLAILQLGQRLDSPLGIMAVLRQDRAKRPSLLLLLLLLGSFLFINGRRYCFCILLLPCCGGCACFSCCTTWLCCACSGLPDNICWNRAEHIGI